MANHERRVVFFDLDGTLHQQDMFGTFMRYLLRRQPLNALLVLPLLPVIGIALLVKGRSARWPMSLLLWGCTFGHSEARLKQLEQDFAHWFRGHVAAFPVVQARLTSYLDANDADIWLITGSPQTLVERGYYDTPWLATAAGCSPCAASDMKKWCSWRNASVRRCVCTAATATASRTTRCSIFASTAGASRHQVNFSNSNSLIHKGCV